MQAVPTIRRGAGDAGKAQSRWKLPRPGSLPCRPPPPQTAHRLRREGAGVALLLTNPITARQECRGALAPASPCPRAKANYQCPQLCLLSAQPAISTIEGAAMNRAPLAVSLPPGRGCFSAGFLLDAISHPLKLRSTSRPVQMLADHVQSHFSNEKSEGRKHHHHRYLEN